MKCLNPDCNNERVGPKYCSQSCARHYWEINNREKRKEIGLRTVERNKAAGIKTRRNKPGRTRRALKGWDLLISCTDKNHHYTPPDFEDWKKKEGIVFTVAERIGKK